MKSAKVLSDYRICGGVLWRLATILLLLALYASSANAATYSVTELGTLGGNSSYGTAINASGQITGYSLTNTGYTDAFLYSNGTMTNLGAFAANNGSQGFGINGLGQVAGSAGGAVGSGGYSHAFIYNNGTMKDLGTFGFYSLGQSINSSGQVAGYSYSNSWGTGFTYHAFLYSSGTMKDLGTLAGGTYSQGFGINDSGQVTGLSQVAGGERAFLYDNGTMNNLGTLGGTLSSGRAVNASGEITGWSTLANGDEHAFLYANGTMTDLGTLGSNLSIGEGINDLGEVVGNSYETGSSSPSAFVYKDGIMTDLNTLIVQNSGIYLFDAAGINDAGQIVATGYDANGIQSAFLLTPNADIAPLPSSLWAGVALAGMLGINRLLRQRRLDCPS